MLAESRLAPQRVYTGKLDSPEAYAGTLHWTFTKEVHVDPNNAAQQCMLDYGPFMIHGASRT